jgi:hypothetical protein
MALPFTVDSVLVVMDEVAVESGPAAHARE